VQARIERLRKAGRNPFGHYQVPSAAIILQQGAGRLIRSTRDRGVVACLDVRLRQKSYGRLLVESLPPFQLTDRIEDVEAFFGTSRS
jgi:ATP-dependent DNA helicase DinG